MMWETVKNFFQKNRSGGMVEDFAGEQYRPV